MTAPPWRETGLTAAEVMDRLTKVGPNELAQKKDYSSLKLIWRQFKSPLIYILLLAGVVTFFLKDYSDTLVILAAVGLNTALGFFQENKAQRALAALSGYLLPKTRVIRDGKRQEIEARELVPGDVVVLAIGDRVPADGVVLEADSLTVDEAVLTGESQPVSKFQIPNSKFQKIPKLEIGNWKIDQLHEVFMGTTITTGIGKMMVTETGSRTKMGEIGVSLEEMREQETLLQKQIDRLAGTLAMLVGAVSLIIFFGGALRGFGLLEVFTTSVAVAVAAIPEGLVVSLTVILALGMQKIFRKKALVRRLVAAETLGSVTVICSDKTGTLTEGKMKVISAVTSLNSKNQRIKESKQTSNFKLQTLIKAAVLCNDLRDPLEIGMLNFVKQQSSDRAIEKLRNDYPRLDEIPFGPEYKYIATLHLDKKARRQESDREKTKTYEVEGDLTSEVKVGYLKDTPDVGPAGPDSRVECDLTPGVGDGGKVIFLSGAPEIILGKCKVKSKERKEWEQEFEKLGSQGYRIVGFAYKELQSSKDAKLQSSDLKNMVWLGLLVYEDPVRESVKPALAECRRAGIKVKVITGDYASTAAAVLAKLGLLENRMQRNANLPAHAYLTAVRQVRQAGGRQGAQKRQTRDTGELQSGKAAKFQSNHGETITGDELEKMTDEELKTRIDDIVLFARTSPQQKLRIVKALQAKGEVVAMTGDGVNDAPAVKAADIGIVVAEASDVSKETADMVLLDSNFGTIVSAVEGGRLIFENIRKVVFYLLSDSFMEVALVAGSLVLGLPLPVTAAQILWINLAEDALPGMSLSFEKGRDNLMVEPPRPSDKAILSRRLGGAVISVGVATSVILLGLFFAFVKKIVVVSHPQTVIFVALGAISLFNVFAARSLRRPLWQYKFWDNQRMNIAVVVGFGLLVLAVYLPPLRRLLDTQPLDPGEWLLLVFLGAGNLVVVEGVKKAFLWTKSKSC